MKTLLRSFVLAALAIALPIGLLAQTNDATPSLPQQRSRQAPTTTELQEQMKQMHDQLQAEIDALKHELSLRVKQLRAMQTVQASHADTDRASRQRGTEDETGEASLQALPQPVQQAKAATVAPVAIVPPEISAERREAGQPQSLHYKGITLTPGGFVAGESVWRQRAMNADIYTNWNSTPYQNAGEAHVSEWVPSARQSRISLLAAGKTPWGDVKGYFEGDFLSAGVTSNNLQSNSYTLRVRQAWAQVDLVHTIFTGGQMWTLLTENKRAATPGQEAFPLFFDANLHVGYSYARQMGFRVERALTPTVTLAAALENSQDQFNASNAPSNFFFGAAGAGGGLENPSATYTNQVAPDVAVKASFDPHFGHYEVGGVVRFFRDRYYPSSSSAADAKNDTKIGGGLLLNARVPVTSRAEMGLHLLAGDGTGRYGASILPDITVHPDGTLEPLRNAQALFSLEVHPTRKFDLFGYAGMEYAQRTFYTSSDGTLVGYAPPSLSNAGCNVESLPTGSTGAAPGTSGCAGATRDVVEGTLGWLYRPYSGPAGRLQYGFAYSYLVRNGWTGVGGAPRAANNLFYTTFRYYIP